MYFELRQYKIKAGQRDNWVKFMEEKVIPFHVSKGIVVVGSFTCPEQPDTYVWIRRFESEEQQKWYSKQVAESEYWQKEVVPTINEWNDRSAMVVTRLAATPRSVIQ